MLNKHQSIHLLKIYSVLLMYHGDKLLLKHSRGDFVLKKKKKKKKTLPIFELTKSSPQFNSKNTVIWACLFFKTTIYLTLYYTPKWCLTWLSHTIYTKRCLTLLSHTINTAISSHMSYKWLESTIINKVITIILENSK